MNNLFQQRREAIIKEYEHLVAVKNEPVLPGNGIYERYKNPILTAAHAPVFWRYDLSPETNPYFMEWFGINCTFNSGAMKWKGNYILAVRVEGNARKSFFAIAESPNGIDNFRFWDHPITLPETSDPDTNVYDMRLTQHEDFGTS